MQTEGQTTEGVTSSNNPIEGVSTSTPIFDAPTPSTGEPSSGSFLESLPESLRSEKAFENVKSLDDLANQFMNAQKMIGKKTVGVPSADSTPEEIKSFYEKLRPESAEAYEFGTEHLPEGIERNAEIDAKVKSLLHEAGLSQDQAKKVVESYEKLTYELNPVMTEEQKDQDFEAKGRELLGNDYESVIEGAMKVSADLTPDSVKDIVKGFDNEQLIAFAAVINNVKDKYMGEDRSGNGDGSAPRGMTDSERREKAGQLLAEMEKVGPMSPKYEELNQQRRALYK